MAPQARTRAQAHRVQGNNRIRSSSESESFPALYSAPGSDLAADGSNSACGRRCLPAVAGFRFARGGLPDHSGAHVLPRRRASGDGLVSDCATGAAVRPDARTEADDVGQLRRRFGDHARIQPGRKYRCGRARGSGGHQCRNQLSAYRSTQSAHLQQGEPGGRAHHDAGADLRFVAAGQG